MKKIITIFILSLLLVPAMYIIQLSDAHARGHGHQQRQVKRAYAAGAIRGQQRAHVRSHVKKHKKRARTRRAVRGAVRVGVGAALIHNARERDRDRY